MAVVGLRLQRQQLATCNLCPTAHGLSQVWVGVDIGGTKTAGGVVLLPEGAVLARRVIPTRPARQGMDVLLDTLDLAQRLMRIFTSIGDAVDGIGAGVAALVTIDGEIASAGTIPWRGLPVRQLLSQLAPAVVESDVRAAAMAEAAYGVGRADSCLPTTRSELLWSDGSSRTSVRSRRA